jgi:hypothetical protein
MATPYNRRCALCGQFVAMSDREAMLLEDRWQWSESVVDDARPASVHDCTDRDPHGARESERLIEAGLMVPELGWLIALELERKQAAGRPAWSVFTGPAASIAMVPMAVDALACYGTASGPLRAPEGRVHGQVPASAPGRSPPWYARTVGSCP